MSKARVAQAFRAETLVYLLHSGLLVFNPDDETNLFENLRADSDAWTDVAGLSPWVLHVRGGATGENLSEVLTDVRAAAAAAGSEWSAAILRRRGHDLQESYAVMTLETLTKILRGEAPAPVHAPHPVAASQGEAKPLRAGHGPRAEVPPGVQDRPPAGTGRNPYS